MEPFTELEAVAAPIDIANCDTDQIIPARFLRRPVDDPDYPDFLFHDLRFRADGTRTDFILNQPPYAAARIIVTERNWGCGSSRENAVTALVKNGIRCVIAPSFGDIHYNNCLKRGVLPVRLADAECAALRAALHAAPGARVRVDLAGQRVTGPGGPGEPGDKEYGFEIEPFDKVRLSKGLDDIDLTLEQIGEIERYERERPERLGWLSP